jgi:NTP pyrophosphatase (non-canonical NTP hydrolase)
MTETKQTRPTSYLKDAARTRLKGEALQQELARFKEMTGHEAGELTAETSHALLGIQTETAEILDIFKKRLAYGKYTDAEFKAALEDEVGDLLWYVALNFDMIALREGEEANKEQNWSSWLYENFAPIPEDSVKETLYRIILKPARATWVEIARVALSLSGSDVGTVLRKNIAKLKTRYPTAFDEKKAQQPDKKAESEAQAAV